MHVRSWISQLVYAIHIGGHLPSKFSRNLSPVFHLTTMSKHYFDMTSDPCNIAGYILISMINATHIDGLEQDHGNSSVLANELP